MNDSMITCAVYNDLLLLSMDGLLSGQSQEMLDEHLLSCEECRKLYSEMNFDLHDLQTNSTSTNRVLVSRKLKRRFTLKSKVRIVLWGYTLFMLLLLCGFIAAISFAT